MPPQAARQGCLRLTDWLVETAAEFAAAGIDGAQRDARLLAAAGCGLGMAELLADPSRPLDEASLARLEDLRRRRLRREPVSRILGRRGFMDLDLEITPATLDPRPDTETVVEAALRLLAADGRAAEPLDLCDLGTGSGAILIALLAGLPQARGLGIDISPAALEIARRNTRSCGVADRARFQAASWLDGVDAAFDVIVSNPPYIATAELAGLQPEVARHDPVTALDGGIDGLDAYRAIAAVADRHLKPRGWLILEVGAGQADRVAALFDQAELATARGEPRRFRDLAGHVRCVAMRHRFLGEIKKK